MPVLHAKTAKTTEFRREMSYTWGRYLARAHNPPLVASKDDHARILADMGDGRDPVTGLLTSGNRKTFPRSGDKTIATTGLGVDLDEGGKSFAHYCDVLRATELECVLHSSWSHLKTRNELSVEGALTKAYPRQIEHQRAVMAQMANLIIHDTPGILGFFGARVFGAGAGACFLSAFTALV